MLSYLWFNEIKFIEKSMILNTICVVFALINLPFKFPTRGSCRNFTMNVFMIDTWGWAMIRHFPAISSMILPEK